MITFDFSIQLFKILLLFVLIMFVIFCNVSSKYLKFSHENIPFDKTKPFVYFILKKGKLEDNSKNLPSNFL